MNNSLIKNLKAKILAFLCITTTSFCCAFAVQSPVQHAEFIKQTDLIVEGKIINVKYLKTVKLSANLSYKHAQSTLEINKTFDKNSLTASPNVNKEHITINWRTNTENTDPSKMWTGPSFAQFGKIGDNFYVYLKKNKDNTYSAAAWNAICQSSDKDCIKNIDGVTKNQTCNMNK